MLKFVVAAFAFTFYSAASPAWPSLRSAVDDAHNPTRRLQRNRNSGCRSVALRLMPSPSVRAYEICFRAKLKPNSTHDWGIPGAEVLAQLECWCKHNLTATMEDYGCCDHDDVYPMCTAKCEPDCTSALANTCVQTCPSMCFEAAEYVVDASLCRKCDWTTCWPVLKCLTKHAEKRVENGSLSRTCHETEFRNRPELPKYWQCWKNAPKHSSHWNVLSSIVNCICREGMQEITKNASCCESVLYGGGACKLECLTETECVSQAAQTCVHGCQIKCPSVDMAPSQDCARHCLEADAPCRKYISCRPPTQSGFVCDDGRWPEANSGCCIDPQTRYVGCPKLCESERIWRLDRVQGIPWWARWHTGRGIVAQCTCSGCPSTEAGAQEKLKKTVKEGLWDNGQIMLIDIARRIGLKYGPNRRMQELMVSRNNEIMDVIGETNKTSFNLDRRIDAINERYSSQIIAAAIQYPDAPRLQVEQEETSEATQIVVVVACTVLLLGAVACATHLIIRSRRKQNDLSAFPQGENVVVGQPVTSNPEIVPGTIQGGTPVTIAAPMKGGQKSITGPGWGMTE